MGVPPSGKGSTWQAADGLASISPVRWHGAFPPPPTPTLLCSPARGPGGRGWRGEEAWRVGVPNRRVRGGAPTTGAARMVMGASVSPPTSTLRARRHQRSKFGLCSLCVVTSFGCCVDYSDQCLIRLIDNYVGNINGVSHDMTKTHLRLGPRLLIRSQPLVPWHGKSTETVQRGLQPTRLVSVLRIYNSVWDDERRRCSGLVPKPCLDFFVLSKKPSG